MKIPYKKTKPTKRKYIKQLSSRTEKWTENKSKKETNIHTTRNQIANYTAQSTTENNKLWRILFTWKHFLHIDDLVTPTIKSPHHTK